MIVLDTNVLSEAVRPAPSSTVLKWLAAQDPMGVFTTTITQAEILYGVEVMPPGKRRTALSAATEQMFSKEFEGRILSFDEKSARWFASVVCGREAIGRPISQMDAMIASIARGRRAVVATRNVSDFEFCGIGVVNPWDE